MPAGWGLAAVAGSSLLSGIFGASASESAAKTQASASEEAAALQYQMYQQTASRLQPWTDVGSSAATELGGLLGLTGYGVSGAGGLTAGTLMQGFSPTMSTLQQTPGYQFTLQQGEQATQNQATAMGQGGGVMPGGGLSVSGPEGKGLTNYAEGLASTTYQQQFQNYWTQLSNIYNMLSGVSTQGANAAAGTGQAGTTAASNAGSALQSAGASTAAGTVGAANSVSNALSNFSSSAMTSAILSNVNKTTNPIGAVGGSATLASNASNVGSGTIGQAFANNPGG